VLSPEEIALRDDLISRLRQHGGNITAVAAELGKGRTQVQRWLKRFGLDARTYGRQ
jgi:transcriptional regulator of acetoin/glycerol metabolism